VCWSAGASDADPEVRLERHFSDVPAERGDARGQLGGHGSIVEHRQRHVDRGRAVLGSAWQTSKLVVRAKRLAEARRVALGHDPEQPHLIRCIEEVLCCSYFLVMGAAGFEPATSRV
jgi:hypothetical protein